MKRVFILCTSILCMGFLAPSNVNSDRNPCPERMIFISSSIFTMGSSNGELNEMPPHTVSLSPFCIDMYEVTNREYSECVRKGRCKENLKFRGYTDDEQPVVGVSYQDAKNFCLFKGKRLPTEAEWERTAKGTAPEKPWTPLKCESANFGNGISRECEGRNPGKPVKVGSYPPHGGLNIYDLFGNVWEWVEDVYDPEYYRYSETTNPKGPSKEQVYGECDQVLRVVRGGSCFSPSSRLTPTYRTGEVENVRAYSIGFRCAMSAMTSKTSPMTEEK